MTQFVWTPHATKHKLWPLKTILWDLMTSRTYIYLVFVWKSPISNRVFNHLEMEGHIQKDEALFTQIIRGPIYIYAYDLPVSFHIKFSTNIFVIYKSIISFIFSVSAHCSWSLLLKKLSVFFISFHYIYWDF